MSRIPWSSLAALAKTIIKVAQTGVHDPAQLSALAIKELGVR